MVVTLREQKRIADPVWHEFLQRMRKGTVEDSHLRMLRSLVVGKHTSNSVDFSTDPWRTAALVTPRHAVRNQWNASALRRMCQETGRQIFVCTANDTTKGRPLTIKEKCCLDSGSSPWTHSEAVASCRKGFAVSSGNCAGYASHGYGQPRDRSRYHEWCSGRDGGHRIGQG